MTDREQKRRRPRAPAALVAALDDASDAKLSAIVRTSAS